MENQESLTIMKDGVEVTCDICFSFTSEETKKGYVAYTDHSLDENGDENVYVKSFDPNDPNQEMNDLSDEEYDLVEEVMNKIQNKVGGNNE